MFLEMMLKDLYERFPCYSLLLFDVIGWSLLLLTVDPRMFLGLIDIVQLVPCLAGPPSCVGQSLYTIKPLILIVKGGCQTVFNNCA